MANINTYIKAFLLSAGGHQGIHKADQAGNQIYIYSQNICPNKLWYFQNDKRVAVHVKSTVSMFLQVYGMNTLFHISVYGLWINQTWHVSKSTYTFVIHEIYLIVHRSFKLVGW